MCSIRSLLVLMGVMLAAAGCQGVPKTQPLSPVNNTPLVVDEAMQIRDWDRSTSVYANGAMVAGGTAYCWEAADWVKEPDRKLVDAPVAVLNFICMPVGLFVNSPFEKQVIHGEIVPPTYTGQPPLPGRSPDAYRPTPNGTEVLTPAGEPAAPPTPATTEPPAAAPTEPPAPAEMPPAPPTNDTPQPLPVPVTPPPPAQPDPITPDPAPAPPPAVEPAPPAAPAPTAPPPATADPLNK